MDVLKLVWKSEVSLFVFVHTKLKCIDVLYWTKNTLLTWVNFGISSFFKFYSILYFTFAEKIPEIIKTLCSKCKPEHIEAGRLAINYTCTTRGKDFDDIRNTLDPDGSSLKKAEEKYGKMSCLPWEPAKTNFLFKNLLSFGNKLVLICF